MFTCPQQCQWKRFLPSFPILSIASTLEIPMTIVEDIYLPPMSMEVLPLWNPDYCPWYCHSGIPTIVPGIATVGKWHSRFLYFHHSGILTIVPGIATLWNPDYCPWYCHSGNWKIFTCPQCQWKRFLPSFPILSWKASTLEIPLTIVEDIYLPPLSMETIIAIISNSFQGFHRGNTCDDSGRYFLAPTNVNGNDFCHHFQFFPWLPPWKYLWR